ncbi:hypothetical protein DFJ77DRAFT_443460 [Powellomyces hirtus]|nr:hypothetical protein DFJ77DRAFT_443460 [Powellomyces hirtus]
MANRSKALSTIGRSPLGPPPGCPVILAWPRFAREERIDEMEEGDVDFGINVFRLRTNFFFEETRRNSQNVRQDEERHTDHRSQFFLFFLCGLGSLYNRLEYPRKIFDSFAMFLKRTGKWRKADFGVNGFCPYQKFRNWRQDCAKGSRVKRAPLPAVERVTVAVAAESVGNITDPEAWMLPWVVTSLPHTTAPANDAGPSTAMVVQYLKDVALAAAASKRHASPVSVSRTVPARFASPSSNSGMP